LKILKITETLVRLEADTKIKQQKTGEPRA